MRFLSLSLIILLYGCKSTQYGMATEGESRRMTIQESSDVIAYDRIKAQSVPTLADRAEGGRAIGLTSLLGSAVSIGTNMVKSMIAKDQAKYTANYGFGLSDLYFYDQLSTESVFDPVGMQFGGFTLVRTFKNTAGNTDTAFVARFELDTTRATEILNNSIFRLRLASLDLRHAKAKISKGQKKNLNLDLEITFRTSYANEQGQLFDNITLGKFFFNLREAPLDRTDENYASFYDKLKGKPIDGRSFIVPRSFGYFKDSRGNYQKAFSQGAYNIQVKVTESANNKFVTELISDNTDQIINIISKEAKKGVGKIK
ncbi:MAG: hypothetical protein RLZZ256_612 [Bacteroidota bacterium]|jgi:hypothetical protein